MNLLRSWFITPAIMLSMTLAVLAGFALSREFSLIWLGALLTNAPLPLFISYLMLARVARTTAGLRGLQVTVLVGVLLAGVGFIQHPQVQVALIVLIGASIFAVYVGWYSRLDRSQSRLAVGQPLPEFELQSLEGEPVSSATLSGQPAVLLFYRGNWCPLCMAQVAEVAERYRELAQMGLRVVLISPQPNSHTQALARRFDAPLTFYVDSDGKAARALGIFAENGVPVGMGLLGYDADTVLPTLVLVDGNGQVLHLDQTDNYRLRPDPDAFIEIARQRLSTD
jgi:peroxiredoxin